MSDTYQDKYVPPNHYGELPHESPQIPSDEEVMQSQGQVGGKKALLTLMTETRMPEETRQTFWHFNSNTLSTTFADKQDVHMNHAGFWASWFASIKGQNDITHADILHGNQAFLHGMSRIKQSVGGLNKNNLVNGFLKQHSIQEINTTEDISKGKKRFNG